MAIVHFTIDQLKEYNVTPTTSGASKYLWYTTGVGEAFHVSRSELKTENYRPKPPEKLKRQGQVWRTFAGVNPLSNDHGVWCMRVE